MYIRVNPTDSLPIYIQIINQVKGLVAAGKLLADEPIPSVRQLAVDLAVNPNTVARAYLELEHEGITYKRRGQGTFISTAAVVLCKDHTITTLNDLLEEAIREGMRFGLTEDQLRRAFDEVCNRVTATMDGEPSQST
ncbi:MAG: GntR family transcriptional regulator [Blastocatellia bacterium]